MSPYAAREMIASLWTGIGVLIVFLLGMVILTLLAWERTWAERRKRFLAENDRDAANKGWADAAREAQFLRGHEANVQERLRMVDHLAAELRQVKR